MSNIQKTIAFEQAEIKFAGNGTQGVFEGYASVFNKVDADGDIILPGAFAKALAGQSRAVAMFFNHQRNEIPVGKWLHLEEDSKGLLARGELTPGNPQSEALKAAMQHGTVGGLSVGFLAAAGDFDRIQSGMAFKSMQRLREISICTEPSNSESQAFIARIKSAVRSDSEGGEISALLQRINSFTPSGIKP